MNGMNVVPPLQRAGAPLTGGQTVVADRSVDTAISAMPRTVFEVDALVPEHPETLAHRRPSAS